MSAKITIEANAAQPELVLLPDHLLSIDTDISSSIDGSEIAVDVLETQVLADQTINQGMFLPSDADEMQDSRGETIYCGIDEQILPEIPVGTEIVYTEGRYNLGKWYLDDVFRTGREVYSIRAISAFGLLSDLPHPGGIYTGQSFEDVLAEIIGDTFEYVIGNPVAEPHYGPHNMIDYATVDLDTFADAVGGVEGNYDFLYYGYDGDGIWIDGRLQKDVWVIEPGYEIVDPYDYGIAASMTPAAQTSNGEASVNVWYHNRSDLSDIKVYGWLPYGTARENLHTLLFASGVNIFKDYKGRPRFDYLGTAGVISVPDADVYNTGKVVQGSPATSVSVVEHQWATDNTTEAEVLFDNTETAIAVHEALVTFSEPHFALSATGNLTIVGTPGVNYAVVSGVGTLTGKKYTHTTRTIRQDASNANAVRPKDVSVPDCTLITEANGYAVLARIFDYYVKAHKIEGRMVLGNARPGDTISLLNAFGEPENAIISKMQITSSATVAATFVAVANYTPYNYGHGYNNRVLISSGQTWTPPASAKIVRFVLISGGQGGQSGGNGYQGDTGGYWHRGGAGGVAGGVGAGGKVYILDMPNTNGEIGSVTVTVGAGGAGGQAPTTTLDQQEGVVGLPGAAPVDGALGTASTVTFGGTTYSSDNGAELAGGYIDILNGDIYATVGAEPGLPGAAGGDYNKPGGSVQRSPGSTLYAGGQPGAWHFENAHNSSAFGGAGGGAALNGNGGGDGSDAYLDPTYQYMHGGRGGRGANGTGRIQPTRPGQGGNGGYGSGGGGAGGPSSLNDDRLNGTGGGPGIGGPGGEGAPGCVIIYY